MYGLSIVLKHLTGKDQIHSCNESVMLFTETWEVTLVKRAVKVTTGSFP